MAVKFLTLAAVAAVMIAGSSAGLMDKIGGNPMMAAFLPPGCMDSIKGVIAKAKMTYKNILDKECNQLCAKSPVRASTLWPHEQYAKNIVDGMLDYFEQGPDGMVIDKICPAQLKRKDIWKIYDKMKAECVIGTKEFDNHPNLCKSTEKDFPKTQKCCEDMAMGEFKERMARESDEPVMVCAKKALDKHCNKKWIAPREEHFFNKMRKDYKINKGRNFWQLKEEYFAGKCTGKLVPRG